MNRIIQGPFRRGRGGGKLIALAAINTSAFLGQFAYVLSRPGLTGFVLAMPVVALARSIYKRFFMS